MADDPTRNEAYVILGGTVALGGFILGWMVLLFGPDGCAVGACGAAWMSVLATLRCCQAYRSEKKAWRACLVACVVAAVLNMPLSLVVCLLLDIGRYEHFGLVMLPLVTVFAAVLTAPMGAIFGLLYSIPLRAAHLALRNPALDSSDVLLRICGLWLLALGLVALTASLLLRRVGIVSDHTCHLVCSGGAMVGGLMWHWARRSRRRRLLWIRKVLSGGCAQMEAVPFDVSVRGAAQAPPLFSGAVARDVMVVRRGPRRGGFYRSCSPCSPYAVVDLRSLNVPTTGTSVSL